MDEDIRDLLTGVDWSVPHTPSDVRGVVQKVGKARRRRRGFELLAVASVIVAVAVGIPWFLQSRGPDARGIPATSAQPLPGFIAREFNGSGLLVKSKVASPAGSISRARAIALAKGHGRFIGAYLVEMSLARSSTLPNILHIQPNPAQGLKVWVVEYHDSSAGSFYAGPAGRTPPKSKGSLYEVTVLRADNGRPILWSSF